MGIVEEMKGWPYWGRALAELGIALIIAASVSASVDRVAKNEQVKHFDETLQRIGKAVLEGVYEIRHEKSYVQAVVSTCLAVRYVRTNFDIHCEIQEFAEEECKQFGIKGNQYVKIVSELSYIVSNIGSIADEFEAIYTCPTKPGLESVSEMRSLEVNGLAYSEGEMTVLEVPKGSRHYNNGERTYVFPVSIEAGGRVPVRITAVFVKERYDTEVFAFLFPTMGATIRFTFHSAVGLDIGAKARTATRMKAPPEPVGSVLHWSIDGPILPNDFVTVWWQEKSAIDVGQTNLNNSGVKKD